MWIWGKGTENEDLYIFTGKTEVIYCELSQDPDGQFKAVANVD